MDIAKLICATEKLNTLTAQMVDKMNRQHVDNDSLVKSMDKLRESIEKLNGNGGSRF